jgi:hypothetical protein
MVTLLVLAVIAVVGGLPAYLIGQRRGVDNLWVSFIPFAGPTIVLLWSIGRSGWLTLLLVVPLVNFAFAIWFLFALPQGHGRSLLWFLGLIVPFGIYVYALTMPQSGRTHGFTRTVVR